MYMVRWMLLLSRGGDRWEVGAFETFRFGRLDVGRESYPSRCEWILLSED
jgi:hypothetical protein